MTYPQLVSGALAQWPLKKKRRIRNVGEESLGGRLDRRADAADSWVDWELQYAAINSAERIALTEFFDQTEGRLREFTFLDPMGNLLRWSSDLTRDVWQRDPQIRVATVEGTTHISNVGDAPQRIWQTLDVTAQFLYTFGLYAKASGAFGVRLSMAAGSNHIEDSVGVDDNWRTIQQTGQLYRPETQVRFGLILPPGGELDIAWAQVVAQPGLGTHQETRERGGVYPRARFAQDDLTWATLAPDWHTTKLKVTGWAGS